MLATLTVRQLNPDAYVVVAVREADNVPLVRQSGADAVVTSSEAVGRLLGLSTLSPTLGAVLEDLLTYGEARGRRARPAPPRGRQAAPVATGPGDRRGPRRQRSPLFDPAVTQLVRGDRLVVVRPAEELPWAPRPGTHGEATTDEEISRACARWVSVRR